jgi:hypothetical protein
VAHPEPFCRHFRRGFLDFLRQPHLAFWQSGFFGYSRAGVGFGFQLVGRSSRQADFWVVPPTGRALFAGPFRASNR